MSKTKNKYKSLAESVPLLPETGYPGRNYIGRGGIYHFEQQALLPPDPNDREYKRNRGKYEKDKREYNEKQKNREKHSEFLNGKYDQGIRFDEMGYPDFSPYAIAVVELDGLKGKARDMVRANMAVGLTHTPEGYAWHHHQDGHTMLLIPVEIHNAVPHSGGGERLRSHQIGQLKEAKGIIMGAEEAFLILTEGAEHVGGSVATGGVYYYNPEQAFGLPCIPRTYTPGKRR